MSIINNRDQIKDIVGHSCGDSRLSCVDCARQVCPKCMVSCPIGNRCLSCNAPNTPIPRRPAADMQMSTLAGSIGLGAAFGWTEWTVGFGGLSLCFYIVYWAAGRMAGQRFKRGDKSLLKVIGFFAAAMIVSSIAAAVITDGITSILSAMAVCLLNIGIIALGFWMGKCGFG